MTFNLDVRALVGESGTLKWVQVKTFRTADEAIREGNRLLASSFSIYRAYRITPVEGSHDGTASA